MKIKNKTYKDTELIRVDKDVHEKLKRQSEKEQRQMIVVANRILRNALMTSQTKGAKND